MLKREVNGGNMIHISKINPVIKWAIRLPHKYQYEIIREMIECGYLKKKTRDDYEILTIKIKCPPCDSLGEPLWN